MVNYEDELHAIKELSASEESYKALNSRANQALGLDYSIESERIDKDERWLNKGNRIFRNILTTNLYMTYVSNFRQNANDKKRYKKFILISTIVIWILLTLLLCSCLVVALLIKKDLSTILAIIVPMCVTYMGSLFGVIEIIARHVFPAEEEKYVNEMVKSIMENDQKGYIVDIGDKNNCAE